MITIYDRSQDNYQSVIEAIQNVAEKTKLSLHEPIFFGKEYEYLKSCLDTTYVSTVKIC